MITLYTSSTGNGRRAAIALAECGLAHDIRRVDLAKGEQFTPSFVEINPASAIPVLVDTAGPGGKRLALSQSAAILLYCAEKSGKLLPADPAERWVVMQWCMQAVTDVQAASSSVFYSAQPAEKSAAVTAHFEQRLMKTLGAADQQLTGREYLAGDLSIADIALYPIVLGRRAMIEAAPGLSALKVWDKRMSARPAVIKAVADNG